MDSISNVRNKYEVTRNLILYLYYLVITYLTALQYVFKEMFQETNKPSEIPDQKGRVALITGGARGIGLEASKQFLSYGMTVVIVGILDQQREGLESLREISDDHVYFIECDFTKFDQVRQVSQKFKKLRLKLHVLVNNAGVMFAPQTMTEDGHESHWSINYLAQFLLTHSLVPLLKDSSSDTVPSRIVTLSSGLHYPFNIHFADIHGRKFYSPYYAYGQSKLAMLLFAKNLTRYFEGGGISIFANAIHPAVTYTALYQYVSWAKWVKPLFLILKKPKEGSFSIVHTALSDSVSQGGNYYENCQVVTPSQISRDESLQDKLWQYSCGQLGIQEFGEF